MKGNKAKQEQNCKKTKTKQRSNIFTFLCFKLREKCSKSIHRNTTFFFFFFNYKKLTPHNTCVMRPAPTV